MPPPLPGQTVTLNIEMDVDDFYFDAAEEEGGVERAHSTAGEAREGTVSHSGLCLGRFDVVSFLKQGR